MLAAADYGQTQNPWVCLAFFAVLIIGAVIVPILILNRNR